MIIIHCLIIGLISFGPFSVNSTNEQTKTFSKDHVVQYGEHVYGIDNENRAWKASLKNKKDAADSVVITQVHPVLAQKEIISIFTDAQSQPIFEDAKGIFYYEDGTILDNPIIRSQEMPLGDSDDTLTKSTKITFSTLDENKNLLLSEMEPSPIPTNWQLKYFGYIGIDPDIPAPNRSGLTILQCYLQGINPVSDEPITMTISATGPFRAPANVTLIASITQPTNIEVSHIDFFYQDLCLGSAVTRPYQLTLSKSLNASHWIIQAKAYDVNEHEIATATTQFDVLPSNRYYRPKDDIHRGIDINYFSSIIAIDFQKGVELDEVNDFSQKFDASKYPWFLRIASQLNEPCYHIAFDQNNNLFYKQVDTIPMINSTPVGGQPPMVAFGSQGGGSPLFINQEYHFGIAAGGQRETAVNNDIKIEVYDKNDVDSGGYNILPAYTVNYTLPRPSNKSYWEDFLKNGSVKDYYLSTCVHGKTIDFHTQVQYPTKQSGTTWGQITPYPLLITHKAKNADFYYKISIMGATCTPANTTFFDMARNATQTEQAYNVSYTLDFEEPLSWQSTFINDFRFQGIPLPSEYQQKSIDELIHRTPFVQDTLPTPENTGLNLTLLDNSSDLKSHPELDKLVVDRNGDPMALANYVFNEIELTDVVGYNTTLNPIKSSINLQGVKRDALATYLEGAGSPIEQCSLLIYLLRKAGYSAAYVFPPQDTTLMIDRQLSKILQFQIRGAMNNIENASLPELIPVNYPWVTFFYKDKDKPEDPGKWIHLFPWLKDTEVIEGKDIWNYFPSSYKTGTQWVLHYLLNDSNIRNLSDEDDLKKIFSLYAQEALNNSNLSLSDVGIKITNRKNNYIDWNDFPRPWKTPLISSDNLAQDLEVTHNPKLNEQLKNIFDTVEITVFSDRNNKGPKADPDPDAPIIKTKPIRLADIHDRRLLLYHEVIQDTDPQKYHLILSLEPYDETNEALEQQVFDFNADSSASDAWKHAQRTNTILDNRDDVLFFKTSYNYHQQAAEKLASSYLNYQTQFPGVVECLTDGDTRALHKGDMACLCQCYGGVTQKMLDFQANKIFNYESSHPASDNNELNLEKEIGQTLYLMGESYYYKTSEFKQFIEPLTKTHAISWFSHGFAKLSPERNKDRSPILTTINGVKKLSLSYPIVDMSFSRMAGIVPYTYHLDSSDAMLAANSTMHLMCLGNSINEHRIIDQFFKQDSAISTVKLLDIAQGWTPEHGMPQPSGTNNILFLTGADYEEQGKTPCSSNKTLSEWAESCNLWSDIKNSFANNTTNNGIMNIVVIPKGPVTAPAQNGHAYTGMGAIILGNNGAAALISDKVMSDNGGYGGETAVFHENNGGSFHIGGSSVGGFFVDSGNSPNNQLLQPNPPDNNSNNKSLDSNENWFLPGGQYYHDPRFLNPSSPSGGNFSHPNNPTTPSQPSSSGQPIATSPSNLQPSSPSPSPILSKEEAVAEAKKIISKTGNTGSPVYYGNLKTFVMDPVSVVTGEFYINTVDLKLAGPMPLEIRRIYSSQSTINENLGHGWRLSYFSYLALSNDSEITPSVIEAAEVDGSVIAYRYSANQKIWVPLPSDNPTLINENDGTTLTSHNLFNNRIIQTTMDGTTAYILTSSDGSKRTFKVQSFSDQSNSTLTHTRPYLDTWSDNQGNSYQFFFGHNQKSSDCGQLIRITSNNGNTIHFNYNSAGHIVEAFSSDGRLIKYTYDSNGDLVQVTLSDGSTISYSYEIIDKDFIHLLTQEIKPDGRILQNIYDTGRVIKQLATTGISPKPTLSGSFNYSSISTNVDNTIDGTTTLTNASGNTTTYTISHNQISTITTQNRVITQTWNFTDSSRSLASITDPRGLTTKYEYDNQGNVTSRSLIGNITGNGSSETAKKDFKYNKINCLTSITDPIGDITTYTYSNPFLPYNPTSIITTAGSGQTINSLQIDYTKSGGACGLISSLNNNGSITAYTYDQRGFQNSMTKKTGTADPDIALTLTCNTRGDITSASDTLGQKKKYSYDAFSRPTGVEVYDATGALIDWHFNYYNFNGEIEWEQGARLNPVDYTNYNYDRAGHLLQKSTYLTTGIGSWVGIGVGNGGLATTSYSYDDQGNCTSLTDPNGNITSMGYDALGEMTSRTLANGSKESFTYESDGKMTTHTTLLGATESFSYTSTGLLQSVFRADGTTTSYLYDLIGRLVKVTPSNGPTCDITYNGNTITKVFNASGKILGSTSETYDGRGNLLEKTDLAGNRWNYSYDGLNRIKTEQGPSASLSSAQQNITHYYALNFESLLNGAEEWINRSIDAVGRPILTTFYNKDGSVAQNISNYYSGDHQSVETAIGTGKNAITTTTYTDTRGHPLTIKNADGTFKQFTYDANGNLILALNEEGIRSAYTYDKLNHLASQTILPDGTSITYNYDAAGNLLTRTMPEGLKEQNSYNSAGQKESSSLIGSDGAITRNYTYHYQNGLLSAITDPRGFTTDIGYDDWMRPTTITSSGSSIPQQNQTTTYTYDPRGLLIFVDQHYNDLSTGPSTLVSRAYDTYGQLISETTSLNGSLLSSWTQTWDGAGRRTQLNWNLDKANSGAQYQFSYNALGSMTSSKNASGTCSYLYGDNGLLSQKSTPSGTTTFTRDGRGRITDTMDTIDGITALSEHLDWTAGNRIQNYNLLENKFFLPQESRTYIYQGTKLFQEPYMMNGSSNEQYISNGTHAAQYLYDQTSLATMGSGIFNGLGVKTLQYTDNGNGNWIGNYIAAQNSHAQVTQANTFLFGINYPWTVAYDSVGNVSREAIESFIEQYFTWDSFNRLTEIKQQSMISEPSYTTRWDDHFDWKTAWDGLGRRIQSESQGNTINYYYDPEVEFLELGHNKNGTHTWNLYGPDRSGMYGGAQGIGGIESSYDQESNTTRQWVNNYFGDAIGWHDPSLYQCFSAPLLTLGAYGPMLGSPVPKNSDPQWRGHYIDDTGLYYMGTRYYDPINGRFISPDPLGHASSLGLYDYCNGDPVNGLDPDGRCVEGTKAGWANGNGSFAGTYDSSQASSPFAYGLGWTVGGALGDVNAMVARPLAYTAAGIAGTALFGLNAAVESTEEFLGGPGARGAIGFMAPLVAIEAETAAGTTTIEGLTSSVFPAGYQGGPGAMWRGEKLEATLPADIAATFRGGKYASHVLQSDVQAFRFSGGASSPIGRFLTTSQTVTGISNPEEAISVLKLPSGATATQLDALMIPQGERVFYGRVEGGSQRATQLFIENPGVLRPIQ